MSAAKRVIISSARAPVLGPYSQAVVVDRTMYISGQIGVKPGTAELVPGGIKEQAQQALSNLGELLKAAGSSHSNVVKTTVLLKNIKDTPDFNEVYKQFFKEPIQPARAAYQVAALPKDALVEIEAIAIVGQVEDQSSKDGQTTSASKRVIISSARAPVLGPYSQAVVVDRTMYISGQIGVKPGTADLVPGGIKEQGQQALTNMGELLKAGGSSQSNVVKTTVLLKDIKDTPEFNEVYKQFFKEPIQPARAAYQVAALPKDALVEIEAIAVVGQVEDEFSKDGKTSHL